MNSPAKRFDCFAAKQAMRSLYLKKLRSWSLSHPDDRQEHSVAVCNSLFNYLHDKYLIPRHFGNKNLVHQNGWGTEVSAMSPGLNGLPVEKRQLYVCATLPLYYEVDLLPLLERLWSWRETSRAGFEWSETFNFATAPTEVCTMVPVVVEPPGVKSRLKKSSPREDSSTHYEEWHYPIANVHHRLRRGMTFVEVYDAKDLRESFEIRSPLRLCELKSREFESFFVRRGAINEEWQAYNNGFPGTKGLSSWHPRQILPCGDWESLFPEHLPPPGLLRLCNERNESRVLFTNLQTKQKGSDPESSCSQSRHFSDGVSAPNNVAVVVLAPGVCFQRLGGLRLGKGGGFYDRFVNYLRQLNTDDKAARPRTPESARIDGGCGIEAKKHLSVEVIGVGFDQQVLSGRGSSEVRESLWACVNEEDACVDTIATPSCGIEKVEHINS